MGSLSEMEPLLSLCLHVSPLCSCEALISPGIPGPLASGIDSSLGSGCRKASGTDRGQLWVRTELFRWGDKQMRLLDAAAGLVCGATI